VWNALLPTLKLLSIAVGAVSGFVGTATETKDDQGHLTQWGKVTLWIVIISFGVASLAQIAELRVHDEDAKQAADRATKELKNAQVILQGLDGESKRTTSILGEVKSQQTDIKRIVEGLKKQDAATQKTLQTLGRVITRFDSVTVRASFRVPWAKPIFGTYREKLLLTLQKFLENPHKTTVLDGVHLELATLQGGAAQINRVSMPTGEPAYPDTTRYKDLGAYLDSLVLGIGIFRHPVQPKSFSPISGPGAGGADLNVQLPSGEKVYLEYDVNGDKMWLTRSQMTATSERWVSSGFIQSVDDLSGAQAIVYFAPLMPSDPLQYQMVRGLRNETMIERIVFHINGREIAVQAQDLKPVPLHDGSTGFEIDFPMAGAAP
jgi:hypothetical protein